MADDLSDDIMSRVFADLDTMLHVGTDGVLEVGPSDFSTILLAPRFAMVPLPHDDAPILATDTVHDD